MQRHKRKGVAKTCAKNNLHMQKNGGEEERGAGYRKNFPGQTGEKLPRTVGE